MHEISQSKYAHVYQIWCQSVQPFGSFSRMFAKVSSALSFCVRCLAQKHAKNIYTSKIIILTRTLQHHRH